MTASRRWLILAIISSALLLIVIDMTVLYTALPTLTRELGATASQKLWIINIYALIAAGLLLGMGTLGDRLGHKRLFIGGLSVFGLCSLNAAFSPAPGKRFSSAAASPASSSCLILSIGRDSRAADTACSAQDTRGSVGEDHCSQAPHHTAQTSVFRCGNADRWCPPRKPASEVLASPMGL